MKIFEFDHYEGTEVLVAENAKEAIMFYFTKFYDDILTDEIVEYGGLRIRQLDNSEIDAKHELLNEEETGTEVVSYEELAVRYYEGEPIVIAILIKEV